MIPSTTATFSSIAAGLALPDIPISSDLWPSYIDGITTIEPAQREWLKKLAPAGAAACPSLLPPIHLEEFTPQQWVRVVEILTLPKSGVTPKGVVPIEGIVIFDIADQVFRHMWHMDKDEHRQMFLEEWLTALSHSPELAHSRFEHLIKALESKEIWRGATLTHIAIEHLGESVSIVPTRACSESEPRDRKLRILQAGTETSRHTFGGGGVISSSTSKAQKQAAKVDFIGYFPLYETDKGVKELDYLVPHSIVQHLYKGKTVESTLYYDLSTHTLFVNADPGLPGPIFDETAASKSTDQSLPKPTTFSERSFYLGSSLAIFAATRSGPQKIDLLHVENTIVASAAFEFLATHHRVFEEHGYTLPKKVSVMHGKSNMGIGIENYRGIGAFPTVSSEPSGASTKHHTVPSVLTCCDAAVPVSQVYGSCLKSTKLKESERLSLLGRDIVEKKIFPISNGMDPSSYDIASSEVMGRWQCTDLDHIVAYKQVLKNYLYDSGVIADASAPLFTFVGRFSKEKGVEKLPAMVNEVLNRGGQVVVMGFDAGCLAPILELESLSATKLIRVYTDVNRQKELLDGVKKGNLIRAGSDVFMVPSLEESFGLVPLEGNLVGAPAITPFENGFLETMIPANMPGLDSESHTIQEGATAFCYRSINEVTMRKAVKACFDDYLSLPEAERSGIAKRLRERTMGSYTWYDPATQTGVIAKYIALYEKLCRSGAKSESESKAEE